jgi:hypothetical protein
MAVSTVGSGTQTCTPTTEHTLDTETAAGVYEFHVNLVNCVNGDSFRLRVYTKTLTGDTAETMWDVVYANDQGVDNMRHSPPYVSMFSTSVSITQLTGSSRNVPWALILVAT